MILQVLSIVSICAVALIWICVHYDTKKIEEENYRLKKLLLKYNYDESLDFMVENFIKDMEDK